MSLPEFLDLPFNERPDLTPYLIHLTKNTKREDECTAFENLITILKSGKLYGSDASSGFIKGPNKAVCFMDVPFMSLKYILNRDNTDPDDPRYEPYGIFIRKDYAYKKGFRPVLYLSNDEIDSLKIPDEELWRVVRFEVSNKGWISWIHEREWRCKGDFELPKKIGVLVRNSKEITNILDKIQSNPKEFKTIPRSILPLEVICQGLIYRKGIK